MVPFGPALSSFLMPSLPKLPAWARHRTRPLRRRLGFIGAMFDHLWRGLATSDCSIKHRREAGAIHAVDRHRSQLWMAEEHQLTKRAGEALLGDLVGKITKHLKKGGRVRIAGLGILQVRKRAARTGRDPGTGEAIQIKARKKVAFRASKDLKMAV